MINTQKLILIRQNMSYSSKDVMFNANLKEVLNDVIGQMNRNSGSYILGSPTVAIGTSSAAKVKTSAFAVVRDGVISTIAGAETAFTATIHDIADGNEAIFNVYLDSSNAIKLLKGEEVATAVPAVSVCPDTPSGGLKIGEVKVATAAAAFDATTTLLSAGTVTDTYTTKTDDDTLDISDYSAKNWLYHDHLGDLIEDLVDVLADDGTEVLISNPNLAIGTSSAAKIKHDAFYTIKDGVIKTVATGEVAFTATTHDIEDHKEAIYLVYLDDATVKISKGASVLTSAGGAVCPTTPAGCVKLGEVKIATEGAAFDATTTELSAGTVTDTYTNKTDAIAAADFDVSSYDLEDYEYSDNFYDLLDDLEEDLNTRKDDRILGNPTLVIGSSAPEKVKNSAFSVCRSGVISLIAGTETDFTATTDDLADGYGAVYLVYLDSSNVIKILKGTSTAEGVGAVCPATPAGGMKIGEVKLVADGDTFDATTDSLADTWITDTYTNKIDVFEEIV
jgi:hypothetical protein